MSKNKVILDLKNYDQLKEFEQAVTRDKCMYSNRWGKSYFSLSKDKFIEALKEEIDELEEQLNNLKFPKNKTTLEDIKNMNLLAIIKWKLKNKYD